MISIILKKLVELICAMTTKKKEQFYSSVFWVATFTSAFLLHYTGVYTPRSTPQLTFHHLCSNKHQ